MVYGPSGVRRHLHDLRREVDLGAPLAGQDDRCRFRKSAYGRLESRLSDRPEVGILVVQRGMTDRESYVAPRTASLRVDLATARRSPNSAPETAWRNPALEPDDAGKTNVLLRAGTIPRLAKLSPHII